MSDTRDIQNVVSSFAHAWLFAVVAYCDMGSVIHRSTWNHQHYHLPLIFAFLPFLFVMQVSLGLPMFCMRCIWVACTPRHTGEEMGFWYSICSILGLHYHSEESKSTDRLWSKCLLKRYNNYESDGFKRVPFVMRILVLIWGIYQGASACIIYQKRITSTRNATLVMDNFTGIYALNGTIVMIANLIITLQPYEWRDHQSDQGTHSDRRDAPGYRGNQNVWIFEGFAAVLFHITHLFCTQMDVSDFLSGFLWPILVFVLSAGGWMAVDFSHDRWGRRWAQPAGEGALYDLDEVPMYRAIVASMMIWAAIVMPATWVFPIFEVVSIGRGKVDPSVVAWNTTNPGAGDFYHIFWSLWT